MRKSFVKVGLIVWWIFIFTLTSIPGKSLPKVDVFGIDKVFHFVMYGGLGFWLTLFLGKNGLIGFKLLLSVVTISVIYAFVDEWHQPFIGRTFSLYDILADVIGLALTTIPLVIYFTLKRKRELLTSSAEESVSGN